MNMNSTNDRAAQPGGQPGGDMSPRAQAGAGTQQPGQAQQYSGDGVQQQGGPASAGSMQAGAQPQTYDSAGSRAGAVARRGGGTPSLFGSRGGPFEMLRRLDEDMDRLFQQFWGGSRGGRGADGPSMWMPQVELCERAGKLHVLADLPGLRKEDVKVSIEGDQLVLEGERRAQREDGQQRGGFYHSERSYGSFYRSIPLPEGIDPRTAEASFRDGVLDVSFQAPAAPQQQRRQIDIRDA